MAFSANCCLGFVSNHLSLPRCARSDASQPVSGFSRTVPAGDRSLPVIVMNGARPGPTLLIVAGEHGDEYEGMIAIHTLARTLDLADLAGTVVAIVCCSVDAYLADDRRSSTDGKVRF
jgi:predicted deacylase